MSPRTDSVLRFPFSEADQGRMDTAAGVMAAVDAPIIRVMGEPPVGLGLDLRFRITDPAAGAPSIRPLGPCRLTFIADPALPMPAATVLFSAANYATWPTRGILCAELLPATPAWINSAGIGLTLMPTTFWYGPVDIPLDFLQQTLTRRKQRIPGGGGFPTVQVGNSNWGNHAATRFLRGLYSVEIRSATTTAADDDAVTLPMPRAVMTLNLGHSTHGQVNVTIGAGRRPAPYDGPKSAYAGGPGHDLHADLPQHPGAGIFPARMALRQMRGHLLGGAPGQSLADLALNPPLNYRRLDVTRTWQNGDECSVYFPRHTITLTNAATSANWWSQWLPTHGTIFVPDGPAWPAALTVGLAEGPMTWLVPATPAGAPPPWQRSGVRTPVAIDFSTGTPHMVARLPMQAAMAIEKMHDASGYNACTYYSLRRTMRALADNRICGGRLNYDEKKNAASARSLLVAAWGASSGFFPTTANERVRDPATKQVVDLHDYPELCVAYGAPSPVIRDAAEITTRNNLLALVMRLFWPDPAPQHTVAGASIPTILTLGEVLFALWQSKLKVMHHPTTRSNFAAAHVGRGAPGAMVAAGLASYVGNHNRVAGETNDAWSNRVTLELLALSLKSWGLLQFWSAISDYEILSTQSMAPNSGTEYVMPGGGYGHSPIFHSYTGNLSGNVMTVVDQTKTSDVNRAGSNGKFKLQWAQDPEEVWIAANWTE